MRRKPNASTVCFWSLVYPIGLRTNVTRMVLSPDSFLGMLFPPFPERQQFIDILAAPRRFLLRRLQLLEGIKGCLHHIQNIGAALGFGQNITHASHLEHSAHTTGCDHARTGGSRFEHYARPANFAQYFVWDGGS